MKQLEPGVLATTHAVHILHKKFACAHVKMSCNIAHDAGYEREKTWNRANCDPQPHQEKAEVQRVDKRKEITAGKKT